MTTEKRKKETYYLQSFFDLFFHYFHIWSYLQMQPAQGHFMFQTIGQKRKLKYF